MHSFHAMCKGKNPTDFVTSLCSGGIEPSLIEFPPVMSRVHRCSSWEFAWLTAYLWDWVRNWFSSGYLFDFDFHHMVWHSWRVRGSVRGFTVRGFIYPNKFLGGVAVSLQRGSLRLCSDIHTVNLVTQKNKYPLSKELLIASTNSVIRLVSSFRDWFEIKLPECDVFKTAFCLHYEHVQCLVMSFGLTNAPATSINLKELCVWSMLGQACDCVSLTSPHYIRDFMRTPSVCEGRF